MGSIFGVFAWLAADILLQHCLAYDLISSYPSFNFSSVSTSVSGWNRQQAYFVVWHLCARLFGTYAYARAHTAHARISQLNFARAFPLAPHCCWCDACDRLIFARTVWPQYEYQCVVMATSSVGESRAHSARAALWRCAIWLWRRASLALLWPVMEME